MTTTTPRQPLFLAAATLGLALGLHAAPIRTADGLAAEATPERPLELRQVALDGKALPGVAVRFALHRPQTSEPAGDGFAIEGAWETDGRCLVVRGQATSATAQDTAADLVMRLEGCTLPLGTMGDDPLLLPRRLLGKLPLVSLRVGADDVMALALPPTALATFSLRQVDGAVELRFPFGFTTAGPEALRQRAPFTAVLFRTEPRWHYRSALAGYYALYPEAFASRAQAFGGWFFAAPTTDLPNPQHFYYYEGGPHGDGAARARGLGTFPYRESSSLTVSLPGTELPKDYAEAMARLDDLERRRFPRAWQRKDHYELVPGEGRLGTQGLRVHNPREGLWGGVSQTVTFKEPLTKPFVIQGWSRAEGVAGAPDHSYAFYVDVCYDDGSYLFGQCAVFETGTHDWAFAELRVTPSRPVAELRTFALLRGGHTGTAWFDDLRVGPADAPETNWIDNPGFEDIAVRNDLVFLRDNVCTNARDEMVVAITDNLSADVGPAVPMNLLRFTLNVDPDLPDSPEKPSVAGEEFRRFDRMFRDYPKLEGVYIDSVSAWCSRVLNTRREHWIANDAPFTYDPGTRRVAAVGLFGMRDYLAALQRRYNPDGRLVFTNIHCSHEAFPLYLTSDIPGIESSQFRSEDDLFFYRACSYGKPLLLMNFINLHNLDQRTVAEDFHLNAAFWGEIPSTGRFVQRAYAEYGDVTHAWLPAIAELAAAGWEPVPMATGARCERFDSPEAVSWTTRRQADVGAGDELLIEAAALQALGDDLVAVDPVWLAPRVLQRRGQDWALDLRTAPPTLAVTRVMPRRAVAAWLLGRAVRHAQAAARVRGEDSAAPAIAAARQAIAAIDSTTPAATALQAAREAVGAALEGLPAGEDLFVLSQRRELLQARQAVEAVALALSGADQAGLAGDTRAHAGVTMALRPVVPDGLQASVRCLGLARQDARAVVPSLEPTPPATPSPEAFQGRAPGLFTVRAVFEAALPGLAPIRFERVACQEVLPGARLKLEGAGAADGQRQFRLHIAEAASAGPLRAEVTAEPPLPALTPRWEVASTDQPVLLTIPMGLDGQHRRLTVALATPAGVILATTTTAYIDEPPIPAARVPVARTEVESSYSGYSPDVVTDGTAVTEGLAWNRRAWASADNARPHWISLGFDQPRRIAGAMIFWNVEDGRFYSARRFRVLAQTAQGLQ
ncbi:MAG: hypothetical protein GX595_07380, partial [Lentisphaerae bacterium]|nr:hypothetical protein [Lentisphaerota bacterium]